MAKSTGSAAQWGRLLPLSAWMRLSETGPVSTHFPNPHREYNPSPWLSASRYRVKKEHTAEKILCTGLRKQLKHGVPVCRQSREHLTLMCKYSQKRGKNTEKR